MLQRSLLEILLLWILLFRLFLSQSLWQFASPDYELQFLIREVLGVYLWNLLPWLLIFRNRNLTLLIQGLLLKYLLLNVYIGSWRDEWVLVQISCAVLIAHKGIPTECYHWWGFSLWVPLVLLLVLVNFVIGNDWLHIDDCRTGIWEIWHLKSPIS